ncbi:hypothetical protein PCANC_16491 [Puccinia coronata f. sp. avenae]|uniref:Reverse transcriptase RNase H-like domain-containing protein n=1 Tax=Puccinia coronata f. sp. avenae TaxID=200324 RepID=A0A2N5SRQ7_9BASI|nr:hypothetical protein PCANC_16491 [Puccinia coronata f. sp. avenae]
MLIVDYNSDNPLWLFTDASGLGLGAALFQVKDWKEALPIAYESHLMTPAGQNYTVHEQELLAVVHPDKSLVTADSVVCIAALLEFKSVISESPKSQVLSGYNLNPFCSSLRSSLPLIKRRLHYR